MRFCSARRSSISWHVYRANCLHLVTLRSNWHVSKESGKCFPQKHKNHLRFQTAKRLWRQFQFWNNSHIQIWMNYEISIEGIWERATDYFQRKCKWRLRKFQKMSESKYGYLEDNALLKFHVSRTIELLQKAMAFVDDGYLFRPRFPTFFMVRGAKSEIREESTMRSIASLCQSYLEVVEMYSSLWAYYIKLFWIWSESLQ